MTTSGNPQSIVLCILDVFVVCVAYVCTPNRCSIVDVIDLPTTMYVVSSVVSAGHVGGSRGLCIVFGEADVLGMSVVLGMRGVGRMYVFGLGQHRRRGGWEGGVLGGGEWMKGLGLGFTNSVETGEVFDVCL